MVARLNPYLSFRDNAREALEFYQSVLGGKLAISTFGEYGMAEAGADGVMHGQLDTEQGFTLMAADTPPGMEFQEGSSITVSLSGDDQALRGYWEKLSDGGTVTVPFEQQPWGAEFGMCIDKFGVPWMVNLGPEGQG